MKSKVCFLLIFSFLMVGGCATLNQPLLKSVTALDIFKEMQVKNDSLVVKNDRLANDLFRCQKQIYQTQGLLEGVRWNEETAKIWNSIGYILPVPNSAKSDSGATSKK